MRLGDQAKPVLLISLRLHGTAAPCSIANNTSSPTNLNVSSFSPSTVAVSGKTSPASPRPGFTEVQKWMVEIGSGLPRQTNPQ